MRTFRSSVAYFAAWVPVALAFSLALGVTGAVPLGYALAAGMTTTLPAALLGTQVIALCRRLPWTRGRLGVLTLTHGAAAIAFSSLWSATVAAEILGFAPKGELSGFVRDGLAWQFVIGLLTYAVIGGIAYARAALRRQEEQERIVARAETLRLRAELEALRARLDPHFLFNVLQTIGALVDEDPRQVHAALEQVAALLRRRLDAASVSDDDATLAEELADVRDYCALERLRLGARLEVSEEVDPATLELTLPRFTLQPLVENAIRHGIAPRSASGRLVVRAARNGGSWTLMVSDDGAGADPARAASGRGVGLSVIRERIRIRYGERATFAVRTAPGEGFTATLCIPGDSDGAGGTPRPPAS